MSLKLPFSGTGIFDNVPREKDGQYVCPFPGCNTKVKNLAQHRQTHLNRKFLCGVAGCPAGAQRFADLESHLENKSHFAVKCGICNMMTFDTSSFETPLKQISLEWKDKQTGRIAAHFKLCAKAAKIRENSLQSSTFQSSEANPNSQDESNKEDFSKSSRANGEIPPLDIPQANKLSSAAMQLIAAENVGADEPVLDAPSASNQIEIGEHREDTVETRSEKEERHQPSTVTSDSIMITTTIKPSIGAQTGDMSHSFNSSTINSSSDNRITPLSSSFCQSASEPFPNRSLEPSESNLSILTEKGKGLLPVPQAELKTTSLNAEFVPHVPVSTTVSVFSKESKIPALSSPEQSKPLKIQSSQATKKTAKKPASAKSKEHIIPSDVTRSAGDNSRSADSKKPKLLSSLSADNNIRMTRSRVKEFFTGTEKSSFPIVGSPSMTPKLSLASSKNESPASNVATAKHSAETSGPTLKSSESKLSD
jgi:hypothetical protein